MPRNKNTPLTPRQLELLGHIASGLTIEEAAESTFIARQSAYNILAAARTKANCNTVTQLVVISISRGWLEEIGEDKFAPADHLLAT